MRTPIIAGNWKMNLLQTPARDLAAGLRDSLAEVSGVEIVICPTFVSLGAVQCVVDGSNVALGAQNCDKHESGAYTGEVSPHMLLDAGCKWVIIGHSERRQYFGEADELLNEKLRFALDAGMHVMFCIGETLEEREAEETFAVLERQVTRGLDAVEASHTDRLVLAYEPVWAIGTGLNATPEQAEEAHGFIRNRVAEVFDGTVGDAMRIQYGGSVKPGNAAELLGQLNVDGALVGGASLDVDSFTAIVKSATA